MKPYTPTIEEKAVFVLNKLHKILKESQVDEITIKKNILEPSLKSGEHLIDENYKSQLLENAQANKLEIPVYQITSEEGPHHNKTFTADVIIEGKVLGEGKGKSKKEAEQNAAKEALNNLEKII